MTYAVDFDGVIFSDGNLDELVCNRINELTEAGETVVVYTSRTGAALEKAKELLQNVDISKIVGGKLYADFYIDDRSITIQEFLGTEGRGARMTPNEKFKFKTQSQTRSILLGSPTDGAEKRFDSDYYVEGYAARYEPYLLFDDGEYGKVYEQFERGAFAETDFSDVIMQHDHSGYVFARNTNNTLFVAPDDIGLFMAADLGRTERAKQYYADIDTGMITKMSWRFKVGDYRIERTEGSKDITIVHTRVPKVYDVSGVSIPANDNTEINARDFFHGVMEAAARSEVELEEKRRRIQLKCKI